MKSFLSLGVLAVLVIQSLDAAVLTCNFVSEACNMVSITDVTSANEIITISGKPADYQDTVTSSLSFYTPMNTYYIPTGVFKYFKNLQSVSFTSSVNNLVSNAFIDCGLLTSISISQNNFPTVPASFAESCVNVTSLNLIANNIESINENAFQGLKFLSYVMLGENKISCIPPKLFQNTPVINNIDFMNNQITKLDPLTFKGLPSLYSIQLSSNKIASIPLLDFTFTGMTMSLQIMFDSNPIMAVHPQFLTKLYASRTGYMSYTNINFYDSFQNSTNCFPKNTMYGSSINSNNWPTFNITMDTCYNNWTEELETTPVSCASAEGSTTQKTPGNEDSDNNESNEDFRPWKHKKDFFAIISNAMKNFTANVQFY